jgi:hypothetical protein
MTKTTYIPNDSFDSADGVYGKAERSLNPFQNNYSKLDAKMEMLGSMAQGNSIQNMRAQSTSGATGVGQSGGTSKMLGVESAMQGIPKDKKGLYGLGNAGIIERLQNIENGADQDINMHQNMIDRAKQQMNAISNQDQIKVDIPKSGQLNSIMVKGNANNINPPNSLPPPPSHGWVDPETNYTLSPEMFQRINAMQTRK